MSRGHARYLAQSFGAEAIRMIRLAIADEEKGHDFEIHAKCMARAAVSYARRSLGSRWRPKG